MPPFDSWKHHRRSVRLRDHDYLDGAYFVTVCTHSRECLFGTIDDHGEMHRNALGEIVHAEWENTSQVRQNVTLDAFVVMPNHFHVIVFIDPVESVNKTTPLVGATRRVAPTGTNSQRPKGPQSGSLGAIMAQFKSIVTKRINILRDTPGGKVWQRSYYETWLRSEAMLNARRVYVEMNPARWADDENHPANVKT